MFFVMIVFGSDHRVRVFFSQKAQEILGLV
jgi:hypothetical protein